MHMLAAGLLAALFTAVLATPVFAKVETVPGRIVDLICHTAERTAAGGTLKTVSEKCQVRPGLAPALVTEDGKVYQIIGDMIAGENAKIIPHSLHKVQLTGEVMVWKNGHTMITPTELKMLEK